MPRLSVPGGAWATSTPAGVVVRRMRFTESLSGLTIHSDTAALKSLVFRRHPQPADRGALTAAGRAGRHDRERYHQRRILVDGAHVVRVLGSHITAVDHGTPVAGHGGG